MEGHPFSTSKRVKTEHKVLAYGSSWRSRILGVTISNNVTPARAWDITVWRNKYTRIEYSNCDTTRSIVWYEYKYKLEVIGGTTIVTRTGRLTGDSVSVSTSGITTPVGGEGSEIVGLDGSNGYQSGDADIDTESDVLVTSATGNVRVVISVIPPVDVYLSPDQYTQGWNANNIMWFPDVATASSFGIELGPMVQSTTVSGQSVQLAYTTQSVDYISNWELIPDEFKPVDTGRSPDETILPDTGSGEGEAAPPPEGTSGEPADEQEDWWWSRLM